MDKIKILLVQTVNNNLGDPIIADNNAYLIRRAFAESGRECSVLRYSISTRDFKQLEYVDAVIFAGGILKASTERFWLHFSEIIEKAYSLGLPVLLSSIGVEPFDGSEEALRLKNAINRPCVKAISVRDDIESLLNGWISNPDIQITATIDPAIWCPFTYDVTPASGKNLSIEDAPIENSTEQPDAVLQNKENSEKTVGLGVIRHKIFEDYGHPEIDKQYQLDFWKDTADLLESKSYKWKLFTNGPMRDEAFAREVLEYIGHGEILQTPKNNKALVENINSLDCMIACRMHSNIIAYSLGIPSIGVIWNQKLRFWGERTAHPERMVDIKDMDPVNVVNLLSAAEKEGIHPVYRKQYLSVYDAIKSFVEILTENAQKKRDSLPVKEKLAAFGLGSIERKNSLSNSKEAFEFSYDHGFRNFKVDVRLTNDGIPVCINKWEKATLKNMSLEIEENSKKLSLAEFKSLKWFDRFTPLSFDDLLDLIAEYEMQEDQKLSIIVDVGKPGENDRKVIFDHINDSIISKSPSNTDFYFKIEQEKDVAYMRKHKMDYEIIYLMPDTDLSVLSPKQKDTLYYCKTKNIKYLAIKPKTYNAPVKKAVSDNGFKVYLICEEKAGAIADLLPDENVRFIGSIRYEPDHIISLLS